VVTALDDLAQWISTLTPDRIPDEQHRLARMRLLDTFGLIAAALDHAAGQSLRAWASNNPGTGTTVLGNDMPALPAMAALVHGSLAHARDFDDTFIESVVHPGSTVIAAALAVAEAAAAPFETLTAAITVGYEVAARLGAVAGRGFHARGFHATGIVGPITAAAAAGYVKRLDASQLADAMGLATSMSSGLLAFMADGGWSKWLHTGWSAHGGVTAAELAATGFQGPRHGLDDRYGLYGAFLGKPDAELKGLTEGLGQTWLGAAAHAKLYPCAHVIQPYIDAALAVRAEKLATENVSVESIAAVRCVMAPWAIPIVAEPRVSKIAPRNDLEAIASLPFMVAAAWIEGRVDLKTLDQKTIENPDIRALAARIVCAADPALGSGFDGRMDVTFHHGDPLSRTVGIAPPDAARIIAKFQANTNGRPRPACDALLHALTDETPRTGELMRLARAAMAAST
jgi:2-methylcitrate dehydratase PrpD